MKKKLFSLPSSMYREASSNRIKTKHPKRTSMKHLLLSITLLSLTTVAIAQTPVVKWDKTFGVGGAVKAVPSKDGGYLLAGQSGSNAAFDKTEDSRGGIDYWIIKIDKSGNKQWDKTFGGTADDVLTVAASTSDGGYIIAGNSKSGSGGDKTEPVKPGKQTPQDIWIVKIDALGNKQWDRTIGTNQPDGIIGIHEAVGGGYLLVGPTYGPPSGDKTASSVGGDNFVEEWIVKLAPNGLILWDKVVGTGGLCRPVTSQILADGGLLIGNVTTYEGYNDWFNMMRVDANGNKMWFKQLGGQISLAECLEIKQSLDGGFLLGGSISGPANGDQSQSASGLDYWIVKTDSSLNKIWDRVLGSIDTGDDYNPVGYDLFYSLIETPDKGVIAVGMSDFGDRGKDKTEPGYGSSDIWAIRLDSNGTTKWDKTIGGIEADVAYSIIPASDGGYLLAGYSRSPKNIYKSEDPKGINDMWVLKLVEEQPPLPVILKSFTAAKENENAALIWQTTSETNSDYFEIQHSLDGKAWTNLTKVHAQGESKKLNVYHYTHTTPVLGSDNLYRLKMVDADGSFAYSKIRHVQFGAEFTVSVYPNPAVENIHLKARDWSKVNGVQVLDNQGKLLYSSGDKPSVDINIKSFTPGLYFVKVTLVDGIEITRKIAIRQ
ncbi:T9SS type A sorting domain-containing protein [Dyadobacter sandarakinus]|uniref:T9SS type A sorting domain-containing protein n=1 Tax=Dyadobacter sandarakinus TaxID=2747268 RepID=A0ABX7I5P0_9BACT|nr:T9SS type A sorting domain-containing protein [Dyadobacter sandarakinus]QRR01412.1 T9SS type A sorting domain-containing protein [Dyadobacter sandarakinus]